VKREAGCAEGASCFFNIHHSRIAKGLLKNNMVKIALRFGLDLDVAMRAKPQA
jgi:hypothetical protein